jgi:hypothetical protein
MDIEIMQRQLTALMKWKADVEPMLAEMLPEYRAHAASRKGPADGMSDELRRQVYAPLSADPLSKADQDRIQGLHKDTGEPDADYRARIARDGQGLTDAHHKAIAVASGAGLDSIGRAVGVERGAHPGFVGEAQRGQTIPSVVSASVSDAEYRTRLLAGQNLTETHRSAIGAASGSALDSIGDAVGVKRGVALPADDRGNKEALAAAHLEDPAMQG